MLSLYQPLFANGIKSTVSDDRTDISNTLLRRGLYVVICAALFSLGTLRFVSLVEAAKVAPVITPVVSTPRTSLAPTPNLQAAALPAHVQPANCVPYGTVPTPSALTLSTPGLMQLIDTPDTYSVYGSTADDVASQLRKCAPTSNEGTFSGATSYWIGTHYSYRLTDEGSCHLSDLSVGVHVSQVLPNRVDTAASTALNAKWDGYARSLANHENGHTAIIIANAQDLVAELSALPDLPCETIAATAGNVTAARVNALAVANDEYDTSTGHGATEGAAW